MECYVVEERQIVLVIAERRRGVRERVDHEVRRSLQSQNQLEPSIAAERQNRVGESGRCRWRWNSVAVGEEKG